MSTSSSPVASIGRFIPGWQDASNLAVAGCVLLACNIVLDLAQSVLAFQYANFLSLALARLTTFYNRIYTPKQVHQILINVLGERVNDLVSLQQSFAVASFVVSVPTAAIFLIWFHRSYRNLASLGVTETRVSAGWAVGWWFVPVVNLVRPLQIAKELWQGSDPQFSVASVKMIPPAGGSKTNLVTWGWSLFLLGALLIRASVTDLSGGSNLLEALYALELRSWCNVIGHLVKIAAALLAILVIQNIRRMQETKHTMLDAPRRGDDQAASSDSRTSESKGHISDRSLEEGIRSTTQGFVTTDQPSRPPISTSSPGEGTPSVAAEPTVISERQPTVPPELSGWKTFRLGLGAVLIVLSLLYLLYVMVSPEPKPSNRGAEKSSASGSPEVPSGGAPPSSVKNDLSVLDRPIGASSATSPDTSPNLFDRAIAAQNPSLTGQVLAARKPVSPCPAGIPAGVQVLSINPIAAWLGITGSEGKARYDSKDHSVEYTLDQFAAHGYTDTDYYVGQWYFSFKVANNTAVDRPDLKFGGYCITAFQYEVEVQSDDGKRWTGSGRQTLDDQPISPGWSQEFTRQKLSLGSRPKSGHLTNWSITKAWGFPLNPDDRAKVQGQIKEQAVPKAAVPKQAPQPGSGFRR